MRTNAPRSFTLRPAPPGAAPTPVDPPPRRRRLRSRSFHRLFAGVVAGAAVGVLGALAPAAAPGAESLAPAAVTPATVEAPTAPHLADAVHAASGPAIVGVAPTADAKGYWMVGPDGTVYPFGDAQDYGSLGGIPLAKPIVGMAATPDGHGYWLVASDGGIFTFGDAGFYGSTGAVHLNKPIVTMASTPDGHGYWLVASDGGVFTFGDARFMGSTGGIRLAEPIVGMAATRDGHGYWMVASDGGIFTFGDAPFYGSTGAVRLAKPIVGMAATPDGHGYWLVASDGGLFTFGDAPFMGSATADNGSSGAQSVGVIPVGSGYWILSNVGSLLSLGAPALPSASSSSQPVLPADQDPSTSIAPSAAFEQACYGSRPDVAACNAAALNDIDSARAGEGLGPLPLPANFYSMATNSQLVSVADAERTSRGLPSLPENAVLDTLATAGAVGGFDPIGPAGFTWGSNIAWGDGTPLAADFGWMYDDGFGSPNVDCNAANTSGCWGHRHNVLSPWAGAAGAGSYVSNGTVQLTQLFVENY